MYPLGILFGLGFDTATEVALLFLAGSAGAAGLPFYAILCLPILFAAGMSLLDTIDGSFMNFAYGWAFSKPVRKVFYNITITGLSVAVALFIGTIELGGLIDRRSSATGPVVDWFEHININALGSSSSECSSRPGSSRSRSGASGGSRRDGLPVSGRPRQVRRTGRRLARQSSMTGPAAASLTSTRHLELTMSIPGGRGRRCLTRVRVSCAGAVWALIVRRC